jgi:hypothetical protein
LPLHRRGDILGQANCIRSLDDIALRRSDHEGARQRFEEVLGLYEQIQKTYSIGCTHLRGSRATLSSDKTIIFPNSRQAAFFLPRPPSGGSKYSFEKA